MATIAAAAARRVTANRPRPAARGPRRARAAASEGLGKVVSDDGNVSMLSSADDFDKAIAAAGDKLVVVDVATTTCAPCKTIYPKVVALSKEFEEVVFLKINGDESAETRAIMKEWGVRSVPQFRFFRGGELVHSHTGANEEKLRDNLAKHMAITSA